MFRLHVQLCYSHHIQSRDMFNDDIINGSMGITDFLLGHKEVQALCKGQIGELCKLVKVCDGCICCFYTKWFRRDIFVDFMVTKPRGS